MIELDRKTAQKLSECAGHNLRRAARAVTQAYDAAVAPAGLHIPQFGMLAFIAWNKSVTITRLAEILGMDRTTVTRNLKPLESKRLLKVLPGADRRSKKVSLTKKGEAALMKAIPLWEKVHARLVSKLDGKWPEMLADLRKLVRVAQKN